MPAAHSSVLFQQILYKLGSAKQLFWISRLWQRMSSTGIPAGFTFSGSYCLEPMVKLCKPPYNGAGNLTYFPFCFPVNILPLERLYEQE
ncbi:hypothetical protein ALO_13539 [Acetonema longum DSM 6540]|uniref:Uncharacterized protein n=1 Tax=Acetonema longum DSM 6540 TaxID=1009370 RepID=F7NKT9_9FIRM|nr:hypothetical protein ALO_13539 [Acetonema longum DSM 6540]